MSNLPASVKAAFFACLAACLAAGFSLIVRVVTQDIPAVEAVFLRFAFGLLLIAPFALRHGFGGIKTGKLHLFGLRGVLSTAEMCLWFFAVQLLPLARATTLNFTVPLFGTILAALILREMVGHHRWLAVLCGFVGVGLIIQPGTGNMALADLLPIAAALCMAAAGLTTKLLIKTETPTTILFYLMAITTPVSLVPALFVWQSPSWQSLVLMALAAAMMNAMQYCNVRALQLADYSFFVGFSYLRLPLIAVFAAFLFGEIPDIWLLPGAMLIIGSTLYVVLRERHLAKQQV
ncbi:DMT family transporter [Thalassospira sp. TSL5-1]|uniref:DMT family transporter n=1 Tax=Thalassospira sp. TSL5-1 TaxID=1544451 RepID=UPI00093FE500|nr:DMT family transporter [Thalassospira sp. TSL5-1]OKH87620.1 RNA polymerase subunit sigma-54 [Thalassospira sp. TSL5-1]